MPSGTRTTIRLSRQTRKGAFTTDKLVIAVLSARVYCWEISPEEDYGELEDSCDEDEDEEEEE